VTQCCGAGEQLAARTVMIVQVYLVQHGQAMTEAEDSDRPLTDQGVADVAQVARYAVERLDVRVARLVHSGKTRARQTAEIWGRLGHIGAVPTDGLAPNDDPTTWLERVAAETSDVMLVGHLPHLSRLASLLLAGAQDRSVVRFRQGGLVGLERTDTGWELVLLLPPASA
jgi:phosphohistidine phosphatase